jgi:hypothetical protein
MKEALISSETSVLTGATCKEGISEEGRELSSRNPGSNARRIGVVR